jgi:hypothetical protein
MEGYVKEVDTEIKKINTILSGINTEKHTNVHYPLYTGPMFNNLKTLMSNTGEIVKANGITEGSKKEAINFCKRIERFNKSNFTEFHTSSST